MEVKDIIRNRRIEKHMTMKELAERVGVSEATISRWESGDIENMRRDKVSKLSKVLDIPPEVIMGWSDDERFAGYYLNDETARIAQEIFDDPRKRTKTHQLGLVFDENEQNKKAPKLAKILSFWAFSISRA